MFEFEDKIEICINLDKLYFQIDTNVETLMQMTTMYNFLTETSNT